MRHLTYMYAFLGSSVLYSLGIADGRASSISLHERIHPLFAEIPRSKRQDKKKAPQSQTPYSSGQQRRPRRPRNTSRSVPRPIVVLQGVSQMSTPRTRSTSGGASQPAERQLLRGTLAGTGNPLAPSSALWAFFQHFSGGYRLGRIHVCVGGNRWGPAYHCTCGTQRRLI